MPKSKSKSRKSLEDEKLTVNQGFVKDSDLEPGAEDAKVMGSDEMDKFAKEAESKSKKRGKDLHGEGDSEAAENYNEAATDFTKKHHG